MKSHETRSPAIVIIAFAFMLGSLVMLANAIGLLISSLVFAQARRISIAVIKICIVILVFISSIYFLRIRKWSRNVLEIASWTGIAYFACFFAYLIFRFVSLMSATLSSNSQYSIPILVSSFGGLLIRDGLWAIPLIFILYHLRSRKIRDLFN